MRAPSFLLIILLSTPASFAGSTALTNLPSVQPQTAGDDAATEARLTQAIKLNPTSAPAYDALAQFYARQPGKLEKAHQISAQAIQLDPQNLTYRLTTAEILIQQKDFDTALLVLDAASSLAKTPGEKSQLNSRIQQVQQMQSSAQPTPSATAETYSINGKSIENAVSLPDAPPLPKGPPTGLHHTVKGVVHGVRCYYPTVLTLNLALDPPPPGKTIVLYTNNYFKLSFSTLGISGAIDPCKTMDSLKAKIVYGEVPGKTVAGQIISIQLSK
jgi:tetratricopeptide (TPR) repeat protein